MKKRLLPIFIILAMVFTLIPPLPASAQAATNPFENMDNLRTQAMELSNKSANNTDKTTMEQLINQAQSDDEIFSNQNQCYIIKFLSKASLEEIYDCVSKFKYKLLANSSQRIFKVEISDLTSFKNTYSSIIQYLEKPVLRKVDSVTPNDEKFANQWALSDINIPEAWDTTEGSSTIKVGVIDSGLYRNHEDLQGSNFLNGYDFYYNSANVTSDVVGHGTMVTSVIAATVNNSVGIAGACWNVSIMPYKVADPSGNIYSDEVISAIMMAADNGCDVINLSLGSYQIDPAEQDAINYAYSKGCIVVAAAGNQGAPGDPNSGGLSYPASDNHVISVGAVNSANNASYFTQHNNMVDVSAPGENVLVAEANGTNTYAAVSGTSFSSPYVASVAALAKSVDKRITEDYFEELIKDTSKDLGAASRDAYYGWGLINAQKVVQASLSPIVLGVQNNGVYNTAQTIKFNKGTATLNGAPFSSGTTVSTSGSYTLIVTDSSNNSTTVNFSIDTTPLALNGITDGSSYNTDKAIVFNYGTATLNGNQINSGYVVSAEGKYTVVLTSPFGLTATYNFTIDKTAPIVTGVENGKSYTGNVTISFNEGNALLNGNQIISGYVLNANGSYHLVVTDAAGNSTTLDFTMENNSASTTKINLSTSITQWVFDNGSNYLCAITNSKSLLFINSLTLNVDKTLTLSAQPTDIIADSGKLYITLDALKEIIVVDTATQNIISTITTTVDPYRLVKDGNNIYYVQAEQWCEVHNYNLSSNTDTGLTLGGSLYKPDLAINTKDHILYIGESSLSGSKLYYYNTINNSMMGHTTYWNNYGYPYPQRVTLCDDNYVFYAGRAFDPTNPLHIEGDYNGGQTVTFAKNGIVFTNSSIYDEETHAKLGDFKNSADLVEMSNNGDLFTFSSIDKSIVKYASDDGTVNESKIVDQVNGTKSPLIPSTVTSTQTNPIEKSLSMTSDLNKWVNDDQTKTLYAISQKDKAIFFINATTLNIDKTIMLKSGPTDIISDNDKLYVALDDVDQILEIDKISGNILNTYYTSSDPNRIVKAGDYLYYAERDQWCYIYSYNINTKAEIKLNIGLFYYPDLAINTDNHILYIGEAGSSGNKLYYYDLINGNMIGSTVGTPYSNNNNVIYDGNYVFYSGNVYNPDSPSAVKSLGNIISAKNGFIFTNNNAYNESDFSLVDTFPNYYDLVELSNNNDLFAYDKAHKQILREADTTPPVVTGVSDGCGYIGSVTITFNKGTALLDGVNFTSGDTVSEAGQHDLVVTDDIGNTTEVTFTIYAPMPDDNTPITFNDNNLKSALINAGVDYNKDNIISRGEMRVLIQNLDLSNSNITDLTGMEYAVNLVDFDLSNNNIADASLLSKLTSLQTLNLGKNKLTDVSQLSGLKNLKALNLDENNINNLSVFVNLSNLTDLSLGQNNITDISLLPDLQNLSALYLNDNKISNISRLSNYTNLMTLDLSNNQIADISPLSGLKNMGLNDGWLSLSGNNISSVSALSGFVNLKSINLSKNIITDITPLGNLTNLCDLNLSDNQIVSISELSKLKALGLNFGELKLANNKITDISPLEGLANVMFLNISGNNITNLSKIYNLTNLLILKLSDCGLQNLTGIENLSNLIALDVSKNNISNIDVLKNLTNLLGLDISYNGINDISPIKNLMLMNLDISNNYLDISANSPTMNILNNFVSEYGSIIIYTPQKDLSQVPAPVISVGDYIKTPTNQNITVTASTDKGTLNAQSHTFIQNGSFDFVATDYLGKKTTVTVTITNIDKVPPIITINPYNTAPTSSSVTVTASTNEGTLSEASHTFTENESFCFVATDAAGNVTTKTVTITNIGKAVITFNSQGGDEVKGTTADYNTLITAPAAPTRSGYIFGGWYKESSCVNVWNFDTDKVTADLTLYAKWIANQVQVNSLIGSSRYDTAAKLSQSQFSTADNIIIVNGEAMADGLGATPLAKYINAPLLLTETKSLPDSTVNEIKRLKAKNAIIVGGTGVVSDDVKNEIQALGLTVTRISGSNRYGTSLEVAKYIDKNYYNVSKIVVSNGNGEADALSISSVAGRDNMPIILVEKDNIPTTTYDWLKSKNIENAYIIGGTGVVSDNVLNKLDEITSGDIRNNRIGGQDRFETNALVIDKFYGSYIDKTYIAKGIELIDALAAGPVAAINGSPVVLSGNDLVISQKTVLGKRYGNTIIRTGGGISDNSVNSLVQCLY